MFVLLYDASVQLLSFSNLTNVNLNFQVFSTTSLISLLWFLLLQMSGLVIIGVTVWTVLWKHHYVSLLSTTNYAIGTYSLLAAGLLAVLGGILGCCGVWREQRALLLGVSFFLREILVLF